MEARDAKKPTEDVQRPIGLLSRGNADLHADASVHDLEHRSLRSRFAFGEIKTDAARIATASLGSPVGDV